MTNSIDRAYFPFTVWARLMRETLLERDKAKIMAAQTEGTYKARRLVYVAKADFGPRPAQGAMLTLDGKAYKVKSCTEEAGVLAIELEAVRS